MSPVDTGQMTPPVPIPGVNPTQIGGPPQSPALGTEQLGLPPGLLSGMPTQIPGQPIHRPSFLQAFLANLGPALGSSFATSGPNGEQNFGTGLAGGFAGVQNYQQKQFERAQQIQAQQRLAAQQISEQMLQGAQTANLTQEMRNRQKVADYFSAPATNQPGVAGANPSDNSAMPFTVGGAPSATPGVVGAVPRPPMNAQPPQSGFMQDVARQHEALGPLSPDEEAQFGAGVSMAARTQDPDSFSKTVTKIVEDRKDRAKEAETARHNRAMEQTQSDRPGTRTVVTGKGVFQYNPETDKYDKYVGPAPVTATSVSSNDVKDIADAIQNGDQPPTLQGLYRNGAPVRAELARRGVPLAKMETDWKATQHYMASLNGPQQLRLRQSVSSAGELLDKVDGLYAEWKQLAPVSGYKIANHAALIAMKNLPGRAGAVANALDTQIAELTADLGNIYMGGNSPTDQALNLGAKALSSDWGPEAFEEGLKQAHLNVGIRNNSIVHAQPAGVSPNSPYLPQQQGTQGPTNQGVAATPNTHVFSASAWQKANPQGDVNAAKRAAQQQGYQVTQ